MFMKKYQRQDFRYEFADYPPCYSAMNVIVSSHSTTILIKPFTWEFVSELTMYLGISSADLLHETTSVLEST